MRLTSLGCALIVSLGSVALSGCAGDPTQCIAQYAAHTDAIKASGQTREAFLASCVAGTENFRYQRMQLSTSGGSDQSATAVR
jgi:hypothetical protein